MEYLGTTLALFGAAIAVALSGIGSKRVRRRRESSPKIPINS